ncbi:unnamed protein product [Rotaria socialis]|uniref:VCBS repeat-containing protein n=1 Tax=Rotaria socialis TaxID=392032 RepID=A0A817SLX3_9BILA|nr:unnamed protein product [Rotaria socialis]CAF3643844.1 unnamed protein product [Rotaria socialis]CAF4103375.1 unnamed protein product [Rotaria socialis]CAF4205588.1 unnamed protein product [Rotaria socialis]CAF4476650.1 unnamed protein product [Rotaria socialis]
MTENCDPNLDIAAINYGSNEIGVILNNVNGTFTNRVNYATGSTSPYSIGVGDYNQDNRLDLIITNSGNNSMALFLGDGNGIFDKSTIFLTGVRSSISFAICDINKDHRLDTIVISNETGAFDILLDSFGGFANQRKFSTDSSLQSVAVGRFNYDTRLHIVIGDSENNGVDVLLGYINIGFVNQLTLTAANDSQSRSFVIGDFNSDSRMDVVVANSGS